MTTMACPDVEGISLDLMTHVHGDPPRVLAMQVQGPKVGWVISPAAQYEITAYICHTPPKLSFVEVRDNNEHLVISSCILQYLQCFPSS